MDTESSRQGTDRVAEEIPSRNLPPVTFRDMPNPLPLWKLLGPGVIMVGIGMAAGEFIIWPYVTLVGGLGLLWLALIAMLSQVFINMEIERYTLATGETAVTGFSRLWKPWGIVFCLAALFQYAWPGWATSASTSLTFLLGGGNVVLITIVALVIIGIVLTVSPVVYQTVEKVEFFKVGATIFFIVVVIIGVISLSTWGVLGREVAVNFGQIPEGVSIALIVAAIGAAGAGGAHNLVLSNWIRDKGYGMGDHIPRVVSPISGEDQARPSIGYLFPQDEENLSRWKLWWRRANIEHFVSYFVVGMLTIVIMCLLAYSTLSEPPTSETGDIAFLQVEGQVLGETIGGWFQLFFYAIAAISLFATALGQLDLIGRLVGDVLKVSYLAESRFWTESKLYFAVVWGEILVGSLILLSGFSQPLFLLIIGIAAGGVTMSVYSVLLIKLNRSVLPGAIKLRGPRLVGMVLGTAFYVFFAILLLYNQAITNIFGG
jgi:hypothetical protein